MHYQFRNVNQAFYSLCNVFKTESTPIVKLPSRDGEVVKIEGPVLVTYLQPTERVLFDPTRDANPFFHLYEALWMLDGRNDVESLARYNSKIDFCSDDGETFWGAYGARWRSWFNGEDQLESAIAELKLNPNSRRVVISMWDPLQDPDKAANGGKDVPCNTHIYLQLENGKLNLTVSNRSNDLFWGMLGANVVQMSILQEWLAAHLGAKVGLYHQFTNNLHYYTARFNPQDYGPPKTDYGTFTQPFPLVKNPTTFDEELAEFLELKAKGVYTEPFLEQVAKPAVIAYEFYKEGAYQMALNIATNIVAADWRIACTVWLDRRKLRHQQRLEGNPYTARSQEDGTLNKPT